MNVSFQLKGFKEALAMFDPKIVRQAGRAALSRATSAGRTAASEEIRTVWNVKKSDLDPRLKITAPRMDNLKGIITISGKGMSLSFFGARQIMGRTVRTRAGKNIKTGKVTRGMLKSGPLPSGVMVQILKGKDTILLRNAFLAKVTAGKSGNHVGVFHRVPGTTMGTRSKYSGTKHAHTIEEKTVISIASMASKPTVVAAITRRVQESWAKELPRQLQHFLSRAGK